MTPYYDRHGVTVLSGDCLEVLASFDDASVDAVVTDPPYGLGFMGHEWDQPGEFGALRGNGRPGVHRRRPDGDPQLISQGAMEAGRYDQSASANARFGQWCEAWARECLRVLKPGGHLVAFGGSRTYHRLTAGIEDAGFEIRDGLIWLYGSGFPKSLDVSKAIDKVRNDRADILAVTGWLAEQRDRAGWTNRRIDEAFGFNGMAGHWTAAPHLKIAQVPTWEQWVRLSGLLGFGHAMDAEVWRLNGRKGAWGNERTDRVVGPVAARSVHQDGGNVVDAGTPVLDAARQWQGWGTALKPAHEPIVLARKPLAGTVAANVLAHGTGALNIDECRGSVGAPDGRERNRAGGTRTGTGRELHAGAGPRGGSQLGRWPSNVLLTHAARCDDPAEGCSPEWCPVAELDQQSGNLTSGKMMPTRPSTGERSTFGKDAAAGWTTMETYGDSGGASRFFPVFRWEAKAPPAERPQVAGVAHPTVKPVALMRWLVRLVTPPGGTVLDLFGGSGTTGQAARAEGLRAVLIERDPTYLPLIRARLDAAPRTVAPAPGDAPDDEPRDLFALLDQMGPA